MITIIVAYDDKRGIGKDNRLPWHIPEDLDYFKKTTRNHRCVMGRKTYESILATLKKPLPDRENIVVSRRMINDERITHISDLQAFLSRHENSDEEVFIIGGRSVYEQALPYAKKVYITRIKGDFDADTNFPDMDFSSYKRVYFQARETHDFMIYEKVR